MVFESFSREAYHRKDILRFYGTRSEWSWEYAGLLTDAYVEKMLTESGVAALVYDLAPGKFRKETFGPFRRAKIYRTSSEIDTSKDVINLSHTGLSAAILGVIPSQGLIFAPAREWIVDAAATELEELFDLGVFNEFLARMPKSKVRFVWVDTDMAADNCPEAITEWRATLRSHLQRPFDAVEQVVMVIDLLRFGEFNLVRNKGKLADMTESKWDNFKVFTGNCRYNIMKWRCSIYGASSHAIKSDLPTE